MVDNTGKNKFYLPVSTAVRGQQHDLQRQYCGHLKWHLNKQNETSVSLCCVVLCSCPALYLFLDSSRTGEPWCSPSVHCLSETSCFSCAPFKAAFGPHKTKSIPHFYQSMQYNLSVTQHMPYWVICCWYSFTLFQYFIYCCILGLVSCSVFLRINYELKMVVMLVAVVIYNIIILQTHATLLDGFNKALYRTDKPDRYLHALVLPSSSTHPFCFII